MMIELKSVTENGNSYVALVDNEIVEYECHMIKIVRKLDVACMKDLIEKDYKTLFT